MPCLKSSSVTNSRGTFSPTSGPFSTEAECLAACKEGACCEGTTCSVKPQCQCQGTGKTFKGVGTVCEPNPCGCCGGGETIAGKTATVFVSTDSMPEARWCAPVVGGTYLLICPDGNNYGGCYKEKPCESPAVGEWIDTAFSRSATFSRSTPAAGCVTSLTGSCPGYIDPGSASVGLSPTPCKIYALVYCASLLVIPGVNPYWAWDYVETTSEYTTTYYVFQYINGNNGASTATQSLTSTPVPPTVAAGSSGGWYLFKTVTVNMRLTLA